MSVQNPYDDSVIKGAGWTTETLKAIKEFVDSLETLVGTIDAATTDSLHGKLGTDTELADYSLYDLLGGAALKTNALSAMLGAFTAAQNLKAILGDLSTTKNLGGILGALDTTDNLKGILGTYTTAANLKAAIETIDGIVDTIVAVTNNLPDSGALTALLADITTIKGYLDTEIADILAAVDTEVAAILTDTETTIPALLATIQADLDNPDQYKANVAALALEATLTAIKGADFATGTDSLKILSDMLDAIKAKTDNLKDSWNDITAAAVKTAIEAAGSHLALIKAQTDKITDKMLFPKDFWSAAQATAQITTTPGVVALPSVTPSLPDGVTITRAIAMMKFRKVSNGDAAANYIDTTTGGPHDPALQVDKAAAGYIDALLLPDTFLRVEGDGIEGGDVLVGDTDIKAKVESAVATTFQLGDDLRCLATTLDLYDIQVGLRIWYSV